MPDRHPEHAHEVVVAPKAAEAHLEHHPGDRLGHCPPKPACHGAADCNDANPCTIDSCAPEGQCDFSEPVSCSDGNPCTVDVCDPESGGCVSAPSDGGACDDGDTCTTADTCRGGACAGTALASCCRSDSQCDDGSLCTTDSCDRATGECSHAAVVCPPASADCRVALCDPVAGCTEAPVTCPDDGNACTVEVCDPSAICAVDGAYRASCMPHPSPRPPDTCNSLGVCAGHFLLCDASTGWSCRYDGIPFIQLDANLQPAVNEPETWCDGRDNNCNGVVDLDGFPLLHQSCGPPGSFGTYVCALTGDAVRCSAGAAACTSSTDCQPVEYCEAGSCLPKLPLLSTCTAPEQCLSGICSSGVAGTALRCLDFLPP